MIEYWPFILGYVISVIILIVTIPVYSPYLEDGDFWDQLIWALVPVLNTLSAIIIFVIIYRRHKGTL